VLNFRIELADRLAHVALCHPISLEPIDKTLDEAYRRLDAHACAGCHAYFFQVHAFTRLIKGQRLFNADLYAADELWREGLRDANESTKIYSGIRHHFQAEAQEIAESLTARLELLMKPLMIFLSHKGADKQRVQKFHRTLRLLGFQPWLDVEELYAGKPLHRGLFDGLRESCACVFFITKEFEDESYLKEEIDYALEEERKRSGWFRIITLKLDQDAVVPEILKRFVFAACDNDLDALFEILRALPVKVGTVHWPQMSSIVDAS
jgi:hypothetical protein